jgi:hypothetical protein
MSKLSDEWRTPQKLFYELSKKYGPFDIDLCATKENTKCQPYYTDYLNDVYNRSTIIDDVKTDEKLILSLRQIYKGDSDYFGNENIVAWCNPPYSNPLPFIKKAWEDSKYCKIVLLVKVDTSTKWWSVFWNYDTPIPCEGPNIYDSYYLTDSKCRNGLVTVYLPDGEGTRKELICNNCNGTGAQGYYNGPKLGCTVHFLPKRIQFDPPKEMGAWKEKIECKKCDGKGEVPYINGDQKVFLPDWPQTCSECVGKGYKESNKWYVKCDKGDYMWKGKHYEYIGDNTSLCSHCKGTGKKALSGPSFSLAVIIMDRRNV